MGLRKLAALQQLRALSFDRTLVTDAGLKELATLKQLQELDLSESRVTEQGVDELKRALPKYKILLERRPECKVEK